MTYADEAHHVPADTYQKVMNHFTPKLWLGMTATPDKRDDNMEGRNVYELFNYQIAYEIRLQQAMEEKLLCPFHYFGITDLAIIGDNGDTSRDFSMLTSEERVKHIINQADYYGYSGDKVKGLIFCSNIKETEELSAKFNEMINPSTGKKFRTIALNGSASEQERQNVFERLAMALKLKRGRLQKAKGGGYAGGGAPFGYECLRGGKKLYVNATEAKAVQRVFQLKQLMPDMTLKMYRSL